MILNQPIFSLITVEILLVSQDVEKLVGGFADKIFVLLNSRQYILDFLPFDIAQILLIGEIVVGFGVLSCFELACAPLEMVQNDV